MLNFHPNDLFANRFRLERRLGEGGFSEVWLAYNEVAGIEQVVKIYTGVDNKGIEIFRREFTRVYNISHNNLLRATAFDIYGDLPYLVMPYCRKGSMVKYINRLNEKEIARVMYDIGQALAHIHQPKYSLIHKDVKPDNILVMDDGSCVLTDFGISSKMRKELRAYATRQQIKTPASAGITPMGYRAPEYFDKEQFRAKPIIASDVWAFGATLYELLTGKLPFGNLGGTIQITQHRYPPNLSLPFSDDLNEIIKACLAKDPWDRPSAKDLSRLGGSYLRTGSWRKSDTPTPSIKFRKKAGWNWKFGNANLWKKGGIAASVLLVLGLAWFIADRQQSDTDYSNREEVRDTSFIEQEERDASYSIEKQEINSNRNNASNKDSEFRKALKQEQKKTKEN